MSRYSSGTTYPTAGAAVTIMDWFKEISDKTSQAPQGDGFPGAIDEVYNGDNSTQHYAKVIISATAPTGLNGSTDVGTIWQNTSATPDTYSWWDGYTFRAVIPSQPRYRGGIGLEAYGPAVLAEGQSSIDIYLTAAAPATSTNRLWKNSSTGVIQRWNGTAWGVIDAVLGVAVTAAIDHADMTDTFLRVFYQTSIPGTQAAGNKGNLWYDTDNNFAAHTWDSIGWVTYTGDVRLIPNESDGLPPTYSPAPIVSSGLKSFFIEWKAVPNPDTVTYRVFMDDVTPVTATLPNQLIETQGLFAWTDADPDGTPLADGAIRYFSILAFDADGQAAVSATSAAVTVTSAVSPATLAALQAELDASQVDIINRARVIFQTTQPTLTADDRVVWYDTDAGYTASYWNGTTWAPYLLGGSAIAVDTIVAGNIAASAITASELATDSVITAKIQALAITAGKIAVDAITANEIASNAITSNELAASSVIAGKLAANAVVAGTIAAGAVTATTIAAGAIDAITITGSTIQTGSSGKRMVMSPASGNHRIDFYNTAGALNSYISVNGSTSDITMDTSAGVFMTTGARGLSVSGGKILGYNGVYGSQVEYGSYGLNASTDTYIYMYNSLLNKMAFMSSNGLHSTNGAVDTGYSMWASAFQTFSDATFKSNHQKVTDALGMLNALEVTDYDTPHGGTQDEAGKAVKRRARGVTAQAVLAVAPHLVSFPDEETEKLGMGVDLYGLLATTIAAVQELNEQVQELKGL